MNLNRRAFIGGSMAAAVAAVVPTTGPVPAIGPVHITLFSPPIIKPQTIMEWSIRDQVWLVAVCDGRYCVTDYATKKDAVMYGQLEAIGRAIKRAKEAFNIGLKHPKAGR